MGCPKLILECTSCLFQNMKETLCFISSSGQTCTLELWGFPNFQVWIGIYDHCSMQCTMQAPQQYTAAAAVTERGALLYTGAGG